MVELDAVRRALARHEPLLLRDAARSQAAVAMILREGGRAAGSAPEVLFIERARHDGDPWSGHMAFPGGRVDAADPHERAAAERETLEEVGLDLAGAHHIGRLDDLPGRGAAKEHGLVISGHVYVWEGDAPLALDAREVASAFWFPLADLHVPARHVPHTYPGAQMEFPGILVGQPGRHVVWGLTYRFLEVFFGIVGRPLPERWSFDRDEAMS
ncbi:MAG: CoA pyrophosphatase [Myxococcales bacterium]|nr:CoA pyrophosphatase [Myxococcales bacterium]